MNRGSRFLSVLCLWMVGILSTPLLADEVEHCKSDKKYNVAICALFKNEESYLKEWIEYHKLIGVEHFYLYDYGSKDRSSDVLGPYIREGSVTLIHWLNGFFNQDLENSEHWVFAVQLTAYENAAKFRAVQETEWLAFLDIDEYLVPIHANTIGEVLQSYESHPGVQLTSNFFDASHIDVLPKRELLIATTELTAPPEKNIQRSVEKVIFKPEMHTTVVWPPYRCNFKDDRIAPRLSKGELRINKYVNRSRGSVYFGKKKERLHIDNRMLTDKEAGDLLEIGFEIEDREKAIYRFESELKKKMGVQTGWNW